ncbi:C40 family peptidase [Solilutibacter silvestris]|uniref:Cell wall-associated hydrolase n=1 Tax=Solilutibacter silvestris TaxID=1645665 RepID=A0A2K1Q3Y6_9GAMM|nr:C40 family peptidase [Lysobacter silvestris]PNS09657.1 Cell wall-associated hydrolase [Lysobacter silvestris]
MSPVCTAPFRAGIAAIFILLACGWPTLATAGNPDNAATPPAPTAIGRWTIAPLHGTDAANAVLMRAISLVGTPYVWGGTNPDGGFDCSGLVNYVFRDMLDMRLPRTSRELADVEGPRIELDALRTGDLIFFGSSGQISHVGIYVGEGRFIHAPRTGTVVRLEKIDTPYWLARYSGARRVIDP